LLQNVETFVPEFIQILPEFSTNQKFWGCACTPASYTTALLELGVRGTSARFAILANLIFFEKKEMFGL